MARLAKPFRAKEALEETLIPEGIYPAVISDSTIRVGQDGEEEIVVVQMDLSTSADDVRSVWEWLGINSASEAARSISCKNLADLMAAIGMDVLTDTEDLISKKCRVRVSVQKSEKYGARNRYNFLPPANDNGALASASPQM